MYSLIFLFLLAAVLFALVTALIARIKRSSYRANNVQFPYCKKEYLFSKAEFAFYNVLKLAVKERNYVIFSKVRLADLIYIPQGVQDRAVYWNKIQSKHVDFVLCEGDTAKPILAIELDDSSHKREDRIQRDEFFNNALNSAGLPLLRIPVNFTYTINDLNTRIDNVLTQNAQALTKK